MCLDCPCLFHDYHAQIPNVYQSLSSHIDDLILQEVPNIQIQNTGASAGDYAETSARF
jgi:hypothetical protein